jgi:hypothetical protein
MNVMPPEFSGLRLRQVKGGFSRPSSHWTSKEERMIMSTRRQVENAMCIFDLTIGKVISLPESIRAKVMMLYSRKDNRREFRILGLSFPDDIDRQIISWLEKNTEPDDILWELKSNRMDADRFQPNRLSLAS